MTSSARFAVIAVLAGLQVTAAGAQSPPPKPPASQGPAAGASQGGVSPADPGAAPGDLDERPPEARPADLPSLADDKGGSTAEGPGAAAPGLNDNAGGDSGDSSPGVAASTGAGAPAAGGSVAPSGAAAAPDAADPAGPPGPPAHAALRESDFDFEACRLELARLGTVYSLDPPVTGEQRDCGIDRPLTVAQILPGVVLEGGAQMRCDTARALAWWVGDVVNPAASRLPGAPRVTSMTLGSTYQCRATIGASTDKLSEHALGNAVDIAAFGFDDGTVLPVEGAREGSPTAAFLLAVRWAACMDFATVLGPGSNAAHENHLHLDVKTRKGGYRVCE